MASGKDIDTLKKLVEVRSTREVRRFESVAGEQVPQKSKSWLAYSLACLLACLF